MTTTSTPAISPVKQIESMYARLEKARTIYAAGKVHPIVGMEGHYAVECSRIDDGTYLVNGTCTCVDAHQRTDIHHGWCKHKLAVELFKEPQTIGESHKVANTTNKPALSNVEGANTAPAETERSLEDQLEDLYPKARPNSLPR
jgi:hypothetical protein